MRKYWTIQHLNAWQQAKHRGILTGNPDWAIPKDDPDIQLMWERCYGWMMDQMVKKLDCPKCYPIWLWTKRPDLRHRWGSNKGTPFILLQVTLEESKVLLSDFSGWNCVLNNCPVELYEDEPVDKVKSWERIFDLDLMLKCAKNSPFTNFDENYTLIVQGVTPSINLDQIKEIKTFTTRYNSKYEIIPEST